jgi:hypothetical protein
VFDGFKIQLVNSNHILEYDGFERTNTICKDIGVIHKTVYQYSCFSFHHYSESDSLWMHGSFHNYFNNGIHNFNNFTYQNFIDSVNEFLLLFSINPINCLLKNVEYGVNLDINYDVNSLLQCLLLHENKSPLKPRETDYRFKHQQYQLKIYNKSEHYKNLTTKPNIFRFEVRFERMIKLNNNRIYSLSDLLSFNHLQFFNTEVLMHWNKILMYDYTINTKALKSKDMSLLKDFKNPQFWSNLKSNLRHRPKEKLKKIIINYSDNIQKVIAEQMEEALKANCILIND